MRVNNHSHIDLRERVKINHYKLVKYEMNGQKHSSLRYAVVWKKLIQCLVVFCFVFEHFQAYQIYQKLGHIRTSRLVTEDLQEVRIILSDRIVITGCITITIHPVRCIVYVFSLTDDNNIHTYARGRSRVYCFV